MSKSALTKVYSIQGMHLFCYHLLSFVIMIVRRRWLAKDEIDVIDLKTNASDASVFKVVPNDLFSECGFTQPILFWDFSSTYTNKY